MTDLLPYLYTGTPARGCTVAAAPCSGAGPRTGRPASLHALARPTAGRAFRVQARDAALEDATGPGIAQLDKFHLTRAVPPRRSRADH